MGGLKQYRVARKLWVVAAWSLATALVLPPVVAAQESDDELAKQSQNPIASLISLPFQNNSSFGAGPAGATTMNDLNIQPVYPMGAGGLNIINRVILPITFQGEFAPDRPVSAPPGDIPPDQLGTKSGLGDISYTAFFSPAGAGAVTWGVGPALAFPTAAEDRLGTGKLTLGPSAVVFVVLGKWSIGALAQNTWSVAGDAARGDVNFFLTQYFLNYNFGKGWYFSSAPIITSNWESDGDRWTVPFGGGIGRLTRIGSRPVDLQAQVFYYGVRPENGAEWGLRLQFKMLFPK